MNIHLKKNLKIFIWHFENNNPRFNDLLNCIKYIVNMEKLIDYAKDAKIYFV